MRILEFLMRETLPQRNYFRAAEVSDLLKIGQHEMRYWESEFPQVRPQKTKNGQRIYRRQDLIIFSAIKHLLLEKKISLAAAQRIVAESDDLFQSPAVALHDVLEVKVIEEKNDDQILQQAAHLLGEQDQENDDGQEYDMEASQIYHKLGDDLIGAIENVVVETHDISLSTHRDDYEKKLASLTESRTSLTEVLLMLEKFHESNFWNDFKNS